MNDAPPTPNRGNPTVLVVEDNDMVRSLVHRILDSFHYRVLEAEDADQALELSESFEEPIELLLTDVILLEMDGKELAEKLLATRRNLRVLFMSGYPGDRLEQHGSLAEDAELISKPFSGEDLARKIREVLEA